MGETESSKDADQTADITEISIAAQFLTLGLNLAGTVGAGLVIGLVIDSVAHSAPWGLLGGLFLGSVGAATALASLLRRWK